MSAPFPMCRTLILVLALTVWASLAQAATQTKTKTQRTASAARTSAAAKTPHATASPKSVRRAGTARTSANSRATNVRTTTSRKTSLRTRTQASKSKTNIRTAQSRSTAEPITASVALAGSNRATLKPAVATVSHRRSSRTLTRRASLRVAMPPPLRGSLAILENQNSRLEAEGMERIFDDDDLNSRIAERLLVPVPASDALIVNPGLPENRRYCRSWTAQFVDDLAQAHSVLFHKPIIISSAVRTIEYQKHLMRTNHNAAPAEGDIVSPHVMGATIDIAKRGLTRQEIAWLRNQLAAQVAAGNIDVEEEFRQACFHITVYKSYAEPTPVPSPAVPESTDTSSVGQ